MKKRMKQVIAAAITMATIVGSAFPANAAQFGSRYDANGYWEDKNNLTWSFFDGGSVTIGRGPVFSETHPEITDPEYYLKEAVLYPGEPNATLNSKGNPKADCTEGTLPLLQEFVNSFDWINSDELTRCQKVFERIANGKSGNTYSDPVACSFPVLQYGKGVCMNFVGDFQRLASFVGLECVTYTPSYMHVACLVKINNQWIIVDPTNATSLYDSINQPVDFDIEYNRYANEVRNSDWYKEQMQWVEWQRQAEAGEITWVEYYQRIYPDMSESEIQEKFMSWDGYVEGLGN